MHLVLQFQDITTIVNREVAETIMVNNQWSLNRAIDWFHVHRLDDNLPSKIRSYLKTKEELKEEEAGRSIQYLKQISFLSFLTLPIIKFD